MITEPMKAPREPLLPENFATLQFPVLASYKYDGIRCLTMPEGPVSRTFKSIPSLQIRHHLLLHCADGLDGELVVLKDGVVQDFNTTQSWVMSRDSNFIDGWSWVFYTFDSFRRPDYPFQIRCLDTRKMCAEANDSHIIQLHQWKCKDAPALHMLWQQAQELKYEGLIVRSPRAAYKCGRATEREGSIYKVVDFQREEATIIGFEAFQENCNVATQDAFGRTKRSKHAAGMRKLPLLGAFIVRNHWGTFKVSGFTMKQRQDYWLQQSVLLSQELVYKFKAHGSKDAPRSPIFVGFRDALDL